MVGLRAALILYRGGGGVDVSVACVEIFNRNWVCLEVSHCVIVSTEMGLGSLIMWAVTITITSCFEIFLCSPLSSQ